MRDGGADAFEGFTLNTIVVLPHYWRLDAFSRRTYACKGASMSSVQADGSLWTTPCVGGVEAGHDGQGYCAEGHWGPLCELCNQTLGNGTRRYFNDELARCTDCPDVGERATLLAVVLFGALLVLGVSAFILYRVYCPGSLRGMVYTARRAILLANNQALLPKLKILIALYQSVAALPTVYDIRLSQWYYERTRTLLWFNIEWDSLVVPGACLEFSASWFSSSSFRSRLLLRGVAPFLVIACAVLIRVSQNLSLQILRPSVQRMERWTARASTPVLHKAAKTARSFVERASVSSVAPTARGQRKSCWYRAAVDLLPIVLFILFCFCASVSNGVFSAWDCVGYEGSSLHADDRNATRYFLRTDPSIECDSARDSEYSRIKRTAYTLLAVWPVVVPLVFVVALLPIRHDLMQKRNTGMVRATSVLHKEYHPRFAFWEPVYILQRLFIVGFVQLFELTGLMKLQTGLLLTLGYTIALLYFQPYKRSDVHTLAVSAQVCLVGVFFGALNIKLHIELAAADDDLVTDITGFRTQREAEVAMVVFNFMSIGLFVAMTAYTSFTTDAPRTLRLVGSSQAPDLAFHPGMRFHTFISHLWSSGQSQVAVFKRQLQLLLPGVAIFLDTEDLDDESKLATYVEESQTFLIL